MSAYVGSSKNLKDLQNGPASRKFGPRNRLMSNVYINDLISAQSGPVYRGTSLIRNAPPPRTAVVPEGQPTVGSSGGGSFL